MDENLSDVKPRYLIMVTADNHNKFYKQIPHGNTWTAEYGRVGCSSQTKDYPMSLWEKKYNEKVRKGYIDQTELVKELITENTDDSGKTEAEIENKAIADVVKRLQKYAKVAISENYTISDNKVTQSMVDEAQRVLSELVGIKTVDEFNETLIRLFNTIPRKMDKVQYYLSRTASDFAEIISREQDILDVMKGQVVQNIQSVKGSENAESVKKPTETILDKMGLEFYECDSSEIATIKKKLGSCASMFKNAWRVVNSKTQTKFDKFVGENDVKKRDLLWHGSRNENWWSIINLGLVLNPTNVVISGHMFGHGIYFANRAKKSFGYTSGNGSYWARGGSSTAFLSLFDVAMGKSFYTANHKCEYYSYNWSTFTKKHPDCMSFFAKGGADLRNDEIIVYRDDQCTIKYLVELSC